MVKVSLSTVGQRACEVVREDTHTWGSVSKKRSMSGRADSGQGERRGARALSVS